MSGCLDPLENLNAIEEACYNGDLEKLKTFEKEEILNDESCCFCLSPLQLSIMGGRDDVFRYLIVEIGMRCDRKSLNFPEPSFESKAIERYLEKECVEVLLPWESQKLLWIGNFDKNSLFHNLNKDIIREIIKVSLLCSF